MADDQFFYGYFALTQTPYIKPVIARRCLDHEFAQLCPISPRPWQPECPFDSHDFFEHGLSEHPRNDGISDKLLLLPVLCQMICNSFTYKLADLYTHFSRDSEQVNSSLRRRTQTRFRMGGWAVTPVSVNVRIGE